MTDFYDRQGNPIDDVITWAKLYEDHEYRQVKLDVVAKLIVSTIWIGFDVSLTLGGGPGLMWETAVLDKDRNIVGGPWRYATEDRAVEAHDIVVRTIREHPAMPLMGDPL